MIAIERNVPLPPDWRLGNTVRKGQSKYPFRKLEIGESFFVPERKIVGLSSLAGKVSKTLQVKFKLRSMDGGVRCWRIA